MSRPAVAVLFFGLGLALWPAVTLAGALVGAVLHDHNLARADEL